MLIDSRPTDRFQPGDVLVYQHAAPDSVKPVAHYRNGTLVNVIGRYARSSYPDGDQEAYQLQFVDNGEIVSAYFTKLCEKVDLPILGDDDSDCV